MNKELYNDANIIIKSSINTILNDTTLKKCLLQYQKPKGKTILLAIGKAAYQMAKETIDTIDIDEGIVITKYKHSLGTLNNIRVFEAGHPILDENSIKATKEAINMCSNLTKDDLVIFLISGGGSALFEDPLIDLEKLKQVNEELLKHSINIKEINTIRKRLSKVKGGKFAQLCKPAKILNIILSDIIDDPLDMIASGPSCPDKTIPKDALNIVKKYNISFDKEILSLLNEDTIKELDNVETFVINNNKKLTLAAKDVAISLGYKTIHLDKALTGDIKKAVSLMKSLLVKYKDEKNICIIVGGEITLTVKGNGLGGRNQEFVCRMGEYLHNNMCFFAIGSDGTDGPTDAAGGYIDKSLYESEINDYLKNNDTYHYLEKHNGLIKTGPTGINVNDLYCILIK